MKTNATAKETIDRRAAISALGGFATSLLGCRVAPAPSAITPSLRPRENAGGATACRLTPEQEEGPFYVPLERVRSGIADGQPGVRLAITFRIVDAATCEPLPNAAVDVWHCNAAGNYSDEPREGTSGEKYLRGIQITNPNGEAAFTSVFPGWYRGRTVHVHVKVLTGGVVGGTYTGGHTCHTGDVFFPEVTNDEIAAAAPYASANAGARTRNAADPIWSAQGGSAAMCAVDGTAATGFTASITLALDPRATPAAVGFGPPRHG